MMKVGRLGITAIPPNSHTFSVPFILYRAGRYKGNIQSHKIDKSSVYGFVLFVSCLRDIGLRIHNLRLANIYYCLTDTNSD